ncbi:sushi, von Willebrand factor type A, EGF and pentraxin domain-containing protein 1-like isoform X3 [Ptychodera flava]|uniref:sushi, von Willebrand factor type A, EGF and pentraxin domain-containing protein 1-like isoform X3 n=1 Tax=Ptychodera flava TaxID=63121 RepID=UPI00396A67AB
MVKVVRVPLCHLILWTISCLYATAVQSNKICQLPNFYCAQEEGEPMCALPRWRCDGEVQCVGGIDEFNCTGLVQENPQCGFRCANGRCIHREFECDSVDDCGDGSDEANCRPCDLCQNGGICVSYGKDKIHCVCQGIWIGTFCEVRISDPCLENNLCRNGGTCYVLDDRLVCSCLVGWRGLFCETPSVENPQCGFRCANGRCIYREFECDSVDDCGDGSDEANCNIDECTTGISSDEDNAEDTPFEYSYSDVDLSPCHYLATCINTPGSFRCECPAGYEGDGISSCTRIVYLCPDLPAPEHGSVQRIRPLRTHFTCDTGYQLHGSRMRLCLNGNWTGSQPLCTILGGSISDDDEKACVKPPVLENGDISVNDQPYSENNAVVNFPEGTTLRFTCFSSHRLHGHSETSVCQDGNWTSVFPTCVDRRSCGCPEATENIVIYSNSKHISGCSSRIFPPGSVIKQRCSDIGKFFLTATSATTSLDRVCYNTAWTPAAASCQRSLGEITWEGDSPREVTADGRLVVYPLPDTIFYMDCRSEHYSARYLRWKKGSQSKSSYVTRNGYMRLRLRPPRIDHSGTYTCRYGRSTHLHSITVQMQEVQCPPITSPTYVHITSERHPLRQNDDPYILGDKVSFSCSYGYQIQGVSSVTCTYTGQWSDQIPTCRVNTCPNIEAPDNGFKIGDNYNLGSKIRFSCIEGYTLEGADEIECKIDYQWSTSVPTCQDDRQCGVDFCEEWEICLEGNGRKWCTCQPASHCLDGNQHVCGSDNITYSSLCRLNAIRCSRGSDLYKISDGRCPNENACESHYCDDGLEECFINTEGEPSCRCKDDCGSELDLVCGTDGNVYNSLCHLNVRRCETKRQLKVDDTEESCIRREEESCQRSCRPDSLSVACERAVDGENFVVIGNLTNVVYEPDRTLYLFSIKSAIPINGREILNGTVEVVQGPAAKRNGCLCPQVGNQGTLYVVFGVVEPDANIQLKLESHHYVAVLNGEEFIHLITECSALFRA